MNVRIGIERACAISSIRCPRLSALRISPLFAATVSRDCTTAILGGDSSKDRRFEILPEGVSDFVEGLLEWPIIGCLLDLLGVITMTTLSAFMMTDG